MANYGGPDPYAFRELMGALKSQGDAMASGMGKLGDSAAKGIYAYRKRKEEQGIDMTAEATAAGLDWEGKAEGKKVSLFDVKRMGLPERQALLSLAKTRLEQRREQRRLDNDLATDAVRNMRQGDGPDDFEVVVPGGTATAASGVVRRDGSLDWEAFEQSSRKYVVAAGYTDANNKFSKFEHIPVPATGTFSMPPGPSLGAAVPLNSPEALAPSTANASKKSSRPVADLRDFWGTWSRQKAVPGNLLVVDHESGGDESFLREVLDRMKGNQR